MNCKHAKPRLIELLYGELPRSDGDDISAHLMECSTCRSTWESLRASADALDRLRDDAASTAVAPSVEPAAVCLKRAGRARAGLRRWRSVAAGLAVFALAIGVAVAAGLRVEIHSSHVTVGWGEPTAESPPQPAGPSDDGLQDYLRIVETHEQRLRQLEELAQLTARELLQTDERRGNDLAALRQKIAVLRRQTGESLHQLQVRNDLRFRLIEHDLAQQAAAPAAVVHHGGPAGE